MTSNNQLVPRTEGGTAMQVAGGRLPRRINRDLAEIEGGTLLRVASVRGEAMVGR